MWLWKWMKRIVFNMCFHGIGGLFWINVLVSIVWIFELDQTSKMLKFWYLWEHQTCWWGPSITCQDREKMWEQRIHPPGLLDPLIPLHLALQLVLCTWTSLSQLWVTLLPKTQAWHHRCCCRRHWCCVVSMSNAKLVIMGCKEDDVVFSQWDLAGLNLGFVPKHLIFKIFGVWHPVLCWFSFCSGIPCSRSVMACPPSLFAQVEHLHWPWASYRVT